MKELGVHKFHKPKTQWGSYVHPRTGIDELLQEELSRFKARSQLGEIKIFMSSATDPYLGLEKTNQLSRKCLSVMQLYSPGLLVIQTRSPLVKRDFELIKNIKSKKALNITLETDLDAVRKIVTPKAPSVNQRISLLREAKRVGIQTQITVSPILPFSSVEEFGTLLISLSNNIIVDTFLSGDGQHGRRTEKTRIPNLFHDNKLGAWNEEGMGIELYKWLVAKIGTNVGWSQGGFANLTKEG